MQLFRKLLQDSDLSETLSFPTESLKAFNLPDGADPSMEFEAEDAMGHPWQFQLTIQPHGPDRLHPEPTLSSGWFHFVSQKGLRAGDEVAFYKKEDGSRGPPFKIEVQKVNTFSNPDIQPTVQYVCTFKHFTLFSFFLKIIFKELGSNFFSSESKKYNK